MYQTKAAIKSVGVVSQLLAIAVIVAKMSGVDIGEDVAGLPEKVGAAVDAGAILVLELTALWGRLRANKRISGLFSEK
jgi:hypothetical protein